MGNFIRFILQNLHFIVFIVLEIVSINLAVNFDNRRKSLFLSTSNHITGFVQSRFNTVSNYFHLDVENDDLTRDNARLRNRLLNMEQQLLKSQSQNDGIALTVSPQDTFERYKVIPAHVISNSFSSLYNFLTINVGSNQGIRQGMGVITEKGPVGIVTLVNKRYSKVISLYNVETAVSAMVKSNNALGVIHWEPYALETVVMREIPRHVDLEIGDTVVTSGYSFSFPHGLPIGVVDHFNLESGENDYTVYVRLFENLYALQSCYVVDDLWGNEDNTGTTIDSIQ